MRDCDTVPEFSDLVYSTSWCLIAGWGGSVLLGGRWRCRDVFFVMILPWNLSFMFQDTVEREISVLYYYIIRACVGSN